MNNTDKVIVIAIIKAIIHAVFMPLVVMVLVNHFFSGNYGGIAGLFYLVLPAVVYAMAKDKDISKLVFKYILGTVFGFVLVISMLVLMAAFD